MKKSILNKTLEESKSSPWDFGNQILYDLCHDNFRHDQSEHILAKVLFIGRIYAVAVERRKVKDKYINDNFYFDRIVPTFKNSALDKMLESLKGQDIMSKENIAEILHTHYYLTKILKTITNLEKRSFSSKYLHFHLPNLFFIFDSRAEIALRQLTSRVPSDLKPFTQLDNVDSQYAKFYCKCFDVKRQIEEEHNTSMTIRQFDNLLISMANTIEIKKNNYSP
jgi:hypothetical protein